MAGSYLISWSQTSVEGLRSPPISALECGATWTWSGEALEVDVRDSGGDVLRPDVFRRHASRAVRCLLGHALPPVRPTRGSDFADVTPSREITVSCGRRTYRVTLVDVPEAARPLLLFVGQRPPRNHPLRIVEGLFSEPSHATRVPESVGVICFTPGTLLRTQSGDVPVEALREGDRVSTRDGGAQEILWIGRRRLSGAQMHAIPELRPIRISAGALGEEEPDRDLVVSPSHRILLRGDVANALFGSPEVLVAARDLMNDMTVMRDRALREVTYIHLLLPRHHIVWANGIQTESFHPASTDLRNVDPRQFERLARIVPGVEADPRGYGEPVRRELSRSESRILLAESGWTH